MSMRRSWAMLAVMLVVTLGAASAETPSAPVLQPAVPASTTPKLPAESPAAPQAIPPTTMAKVTAVLENAMTLLRHGQIGLATIWDRNAWVQCRRWEEHDILCEGAGSAMQPTLAHVLTLERAMHLTSLAWTMDPHFGNYVHLSSAAIGAKTLAREMLLTLRDGYGADLAEVEARSTWVLQAQCPPRNGPRQNLAGSINDDPAMAGTALRSCAYPPAAKAPARSVAELYGFYGLRVAGEVQRLIVNSDAAGIHLVLDGKHGYVQCAPDRTPPSLYCEAASADSMPALVKVLTPERIARLHALGFSDPSRAPNYSRTYPLAEADALHITGDLLTTLYDVYGYKGQPLLVISTEKGH